MFIIVVENTRKVHATLCGDLQTTLARDVRETVHCVVGGSLVRTRGVFLCVLCALLGRALFVSGPVSLSLSPSLLFSPTNCISHVLLLVVRGP